MQFIAGLDIRCRFREPASGGEIVGLESALGIELPSQLRDLLLETNGVRDRHDLGLVWAADEIAEGNAWFRSDPELRDLFMPFDNLLFIGSDIAGSNFGYGITASGRTMLDIYSRDHETDGREWYAGHLEGYLERRLTERVRPPSSGRQGLLPM